MSLLQSFSSFRFASFCFRVPSFCSPDILLWYRNLSICLSRAASHTSLRCCRSGRQKTSNAVDETARTRRRPWDRQVNKHSRHRHYLLVHKEVGILGFITATLLFHLPNRQPRPANQPYVSERSAEATMPSILSTIKGTDDGLRHFRLSTLRLQLIARSAYRPSVLHDPDWLMREPCDLNTTLILLQFRFSPFSPTHLSTWSFTLVC